MRTLVITDVETTGLDPKVDRCIEVAVALYSVEHATPIEIFSSLIESESNAAESINRIPAAALTRGPLTSRVWRTVDEMLPAAGVFVAHRASFDRSFYPSTVAERLPWACSKFDFDWPCSKPGASLVETALAHGVPVHDNHRALTDVMLLVRTFQRVHEMGHDVPAMLDRAMRPRAVYAVADTSFDPERNKLAKANAFAWNRSASFGQGAWQRKTSAAFRSRCARCSHEHRPSPLPPGSAPSEGGALARSP